MTADECHVLFGKMLRAEARMLNISQTDIITTSRSEVPDGGIDARIKRCNQPAGGDLITGTNPSYQIKSGREFKPWQRSHINRELFGSKGGPCTVENMSKEVRRCFENGCTYILVCMRTDLNTAQHEQALENLQDAVAACGLPVPDIRILGMKHITSMLANLPGLARSITRRNHPDVKTHSAWRNEDQEMRRGINESSAYRRMIQKIQDIIRNNSGPFHLNLYGETGVGKTRLALESTDAPDIEPLVVYCNSPELFYNEVLRNVNEETRAVFVVDDCFDYRMWDWIRQNTKDVILVTTSNEKKSIPHTVQLEVPPLEEPDIRAVISQYVDDNTAAKRIALWCGGIPRLAHIAGTHAREHPDQMPRYDGIKDMLQRYVINIAESGPVDPEQAKVIMLTLALFKRVGRGAYFEKEYRAVLSIVQKIDSGITLNAFENTVRMLQHRKILQGQEIMYITPKMLHMILWAGWWDKYERWASDIILEITDTAPTSLAESFYDMLSYASQSDSAKPITRRLFGDEGPLKDRRNAPRTDSGSRIFYALARADPRAALEYLEGASHTWTESDICSLTGHGRRNLVYALEQIMFESELFERGGKILRRLAEAENEQWSNNATGVFCEMFAMGTGHMARTLASPQDRLPLLRDTICIDAIAAQNKTRLSLGLQACRHALAINDASISSFGHGDSTASESKGWEPASPAEVQESYVNIIEMMLEKIDTFADTSAKRAASQIILDASRPLLCHMPKMARYLVCVLKRLRGPAGNESVVRTALEISEFDAARLDPDAAANLEDLMRDMNGANNEDYSTRMQRYVIMDEIVDTVTQNREQPRNEKIRHLAAETIERPDLLGPHMTHLVAGNSEHIWRFGYDLSILDVHEYTLDDILAAQQNADSEMKNNGLFLSGYMRGIFERDTDRWNEIMQKLADSKPLRRFFIEVACRSGITDVIGDLIVEMIRDGRLLTRDLTCMTAHLPSRPSARVICSWLDIMMQEGGALVQRALRLYCMLFDDTHAKKTDSKMVLRLVTHDALFGRDEKQSPLAYDGVSYDWQEAAAALISMHDTEATMQLCRVILDNMRYDSLRILLARVLCMIAAKHPHEVWDMAVSYVNNALDEQAHAILSWIHGDLDPFKNSDFLDRVGHDKICGWIDADVSNRAPLMARYVPPRLEYGCMAVEIAKRYGNRQLVSANLSGNFMTCTFSGSMADHYKMDKSAVLEYKKKNAGNDDPNLDRWLDYHAEMLDARIREADKIEKRLAA